MCKKFSAFPHQSGAVQLKHSCPGMLINSNWWHVPDWVCGISMLKFARDVRM